MITTETNRNKKNNSKNNDNKTTTKTTLPPTSKTKITFLGCDTIEFNLVFILHYDRNKDMKLMH